MIAVRFPSSISLSSDLDMQMAVINHYQWASKNSKLEQVLNLRLDPDGAGGEQPDPDLQAANEAIGAYGGEIIKMERNPYPPKGADL